MLSKILFKIFITFLLFFFSYTLNAYAANVTWDGGGTDGTCGGNAGDGNKWSCGLNWSTDSIPAAADTAIFNSTSTKDVTISANISLTAITINSGYTGTITQGSSVTITLTSTSATSALTQASGTFLGSNGAITLSGGFTLSGGSFRSTSGNFSIFRNFTISGGTFTHNSGTIYFHSTSGSTAMSCNNATLNNVLIRKLGGNIAVTIDNTCTVPLDTTQQPRAAITNSGTITYTGNLTIDGAYTSTGGNLNMTGTTFTVLGNLTLTSGTISSSITDITVGLSFSNSGNVLNNGLNLNLPDLSLNNSNLNCGNATYNSINIERNAGINVTPTASCTTVNFNALGGNVVNPASSYTFSIAGNLVVSPTVKSGTNNFGGSNLSIVLNGSGTQYIYQDLSPFNSPLTISKAAGEVVLATDFIGANTQTCTISQGILNLNGYNFYCSSTFTVNNGTTLKLNGKESVTTPTLQSGSTVNYVGYSDSATNTFSFNPFSYSNLTINATETADTFDSRDTLTNSLIGYWKMEEGSGTTVDDSSTNNNIGTFGGNATFSSTKPTLTGETNNYSMVMDGTGDYLNIGNNLSLLQSTKEITLAAWINKNDLLGQEQIFGLTVNGHGSNSRFTMFTNDAKISCGARSTDGETFTEIKSANSVLTTGTWYHVACAINFSKNQMSLYLNGNPVVVDNEITYSSSTTDNTTSQASGIGIDEDKSGADYNGYLDEIRLYNRALNGREMQQLAAGANTTASSSTTVGNNFNLAAGVFYAPATLNVAGSWTNNGTFHSNSGTVVLNGSSQTLNGDTTFYNLTKTVSLTDTLTFQANKTQTIANTLTLKGAASNLLSLRSSLNGTKWNINPQGTRDIEYLDVKDSNNTNASVIAVNGLNITDSLNNTNWGFESGEPAIVLAPVSQDPTAGSTPTITGSATDADGTISLIEYQMDGTGSSWTACTADDGAFDEDLEAFSCNISPALTHGSHTVYVRATDNDLNVTPNEDAATDSFTVDILPPAVTPDAATNPTSDTTPTVTGSAIDSSATITNIQYQYDGTGGTWRNCTATDGAFDEASEDFSCTATLGVADGNRTIYVRATDSTGNTTTNGAASTDSFVVDSTFPAISLIAISPDPSNDTTPTITGTATDVTGTVANVRYQVDSTGGSWTNCSADDGNFDEASETFSCTVSPALSDGNHTIYIQAIDNLNNTTDLAHYAEDDFVLDTTSATIALDPLTSTTDTTPSINGNVIDSLLTITDAEYQMDGTDGTWNNCTADDGAFDEANEDFTCTVASPLNDGSHTIYVRVTDSDGKTTSNGAAANFTFSVDTTAPSVTVTPVSPDPTSDTIPSISGTATDITSLVVAVFLQIDGTGGAWTACTANDGAFEEISEAFSCTAPSALADGSHTFYFRAIDSLNNTTNSSFTTDTFIVSTTAPAVTLGQVSPDPTNNTTPSLTGSAVSTYSTVTNIQYQIDVKTGTWNNCTADDGTFDETSESFSCTVASALNQGAHTFYVRATDALGSTTANDDLESDLFSIDTSGPTISISALSPDPNGDNTPTFSGTASDIYSTIASVSYQIDGTSGSWSACTPNDSLFNSSSEVYNCTTSTLSEGSHTIYIRANDSLGNITSILSYAQDTFEIDTSSELSISNIEVSTTDSSATINWDTDAVASSIADYGLTSTYTNSTPEIDTTPRTIEHTVEIVELNTGTLYHFRVKSIDALDNEFVGSDSTFTTKGCTANSNIETQTSSTILSGSGGAMELLNSGNGVTLNIPSDFSNQDAVIQIHKLETDTVLDLTSTPSDYQNIGDYVYEIIALEDINSAIESVDNPIQITITYSNLDVADIHENNLNLLGWNGSAWQELDSCSINTSSNSITCETRLLFTISLFVEISEDNHESENDGSDFQNKTFRDVYGKKELDRYILTLYNQGIVKGYPDGKFRPEQYITRGEIASIIVSAFKLKGSQLVKPFSDIPFKHPHFDAIYTLQQNDIISGYPDKTFKPDSYVTRAEITKLIVKVLSKKGISINYDLNNNFADVSSVHVHYPFISYLSSQQIHGEKIIKGFKDNSFRPEEYLTRAQMSKIISLSLQIEE